MIDEVGSYAPRKGRDMVPFMKTLEGTVICLYHLRLEKMKSVGAAETFSVSVAIEAEFPGVSLMKQSFVSLPFERLGQKHRMQTSPSVGIRTPPGHS